MKLFCWIFDASGDAAQFHPATQRGEGEAAGDAAATEVDLGGGGVWQKTWEFPWENHRKSHKTSEISGFYGLIRISWDLLFFFTTKT